MAKPLINDHLSDSRHSTNTQFRVADGLGDTKPLQRSNLCASHRQRRWLTPDELALPLAWNVAKHVQTPYSPVWCD